MTLLAVLVATLAFLAGLGLGLAISAWLRFLREGRAMFMCWVAAIGRSRRG